MFTHVQKVEKNENSVDYVVEDCCKCHFDGIAGLRWLTLGLFLHTSFTVT